MRWAVLVCLLLGGCKVLFQAEGDDGTIGDGAPPIDAAIDAPAGPPTIELVLPDPIFAGTPVPIVVRTSGTRPVHIRLDIDNGAFANQGRQVVTNAPAGIVDTTINWIPPNTYVDVQLMGAVSFDPGFTDAVPASAQLRVQQYVGNYIVPGASQTLPANTLRAAPFDVPKAGQLTGVGVQLTVESGIKVKLAVYTNSGNLPMALVATSPALDVAQFPSGRVEFTFSQPMQLLPNLHWVAVIADKQTSLIGASTAPNPQERSRNFDFTMNLPSPFQSTTQHSSAIGAYAMMAP